MSISISHFIDEKAEIDARSKFNVVDITQDGVQLSLFFPDWDRDTLFASRQKIQELHTALREIDRSLFRKQEAKADYQPENVS
jgi:hypothetical protein